MERPSEICRVLSKNKINLRNWCIWLVYYKNILRCMDLWTSKREKHVGPNGNPSSFLNKPVFNLVIIPSTLMQVVRKTMRNLSHSSLCCSWCLKWAPSNICQMHDCMSQLVPRKLHISRDEMILMTDGCTCLDSTVQLASWPFFRLALV
jgi:hypothetical protein